MALSATRKNRKSTGKTKEKKQTRKKQTRKTKLRPLTKLTGYSVKLKSNVYVSFINLPGTEKYIHYWFIQAEKNPKKAPLFFWTNGGPGCSGLMGLFEEIGPYKPNKDLKLEYNPYTWNKFANIVYVEQPVGVGYSYSNYKKDYSSNDKLSARDNLAFTLEFLNTFPEFKKNQLYITSESYGGHYAPLWAREIIKYNKKTADKLNFKGFIIINPYVNYLTGNESSVETYWGHQKMPLHLWRKFKKHNCKTTTPTYLKNKCNSILYEIEDKIGKINPYAMDYPLCLSNQQVNLMRFINKKGHIQKEVYNPCEDKFTDAYLNLNSVKRIIKSPKKVKWSQCSDIAQYRYKDTYTHIEKVIKDMFYDDELAHLDVLIMSGTNDSICGTVGTQKWIESLKLRNVVDWEQYFVAEEPSGYISKFVGHGVNKPKKLFLATVNFAGHEVPAYKPQEAFYIASRFIEGRL